LTDEHSIVASDTIAKAVDIMLERENYAYISLWESFTKNAKRLLTGLALEEAGVKPFSSGFVCEYKLTASSVQRTAILLLNKDVIDKDNGSLLITDRFFRIWISRKQK